MHPAPQLASGHSAATTLFKASRGMMHVSAPITWVFATTGVVNTSTSAESWSRTSLAVVQRRSEHRCYSACEPGSHHRVTGHFDPALGLRQTMTMRSGPELDGLMLEHRPDVSEVSLGTGQTTAHTLAMR